MYKDNLSDIYLIIEYLIYCICVVYYISLLEVIDANDLLVKNIYHTYKSLIFSSIYVKVC
jgi:hypothetical protein